MASIHEDIFIAADPAAIWDAARDVGRLHDRLVPGFVVGTEMLAGVAPPVRRVTFANGAVADETIVSVDDARRRLVWAIKAFDHHNGVLEAAAEPGGARVRWTADILPDALAAQVQPMMAKGLELMKAHFEGAAAGS